METTRFAEMEIILEKHQRGSRAVGCGLFLRCKSFPYSVRGQVGTPRAPPSTMTTYLLSVYSSPKRAPSTSELRALAPAGGTR